MRTSTNRILTTHAGSLPRPPELDELYVAKSRGGSVDADEFAKLVQQATEDVVAAQSHVGIDVAGNGEQGHESFVTYVRERLTGFDGSPSHRPVMRDRVAFPTFVEAERRVFAGMSAVNLMRAPAVVGDVAHRGFGLLDAEIDAFLAAAQPHHFEELFLTAASPGIVATVMEDRHFGDLQHYVDAVADALSPEYRHIVERGFVLQIDAPDLAMERHCYFADRPLEEFVSFVDVVVRALNRALATLPAGSVRLHVCWGNYEGPHHLDVPLEAILPVLLQARVGAFVLSMANPRHAHEYRLLKALPASASVVAGVIDTTTNYIEHPMVVADRLETVASALGDPRRVMAGTDCGFATTAGMSRVAREVVWEKLRALVDGAQIASERLF